MVDACELVISTDPKDIDRERLHAFLSERSYWSMGIERAALDKALEASICFTALMGDEMVGFARVITDGVTMAYLSDVYVEEAYRGKSIGKRLMEAVMSHPDLKNLRRFLLATKDAHSLYAQYGFQPIDDPEFLMQIRDPNNLIKDDS